MSTVINESPPSSWSNMLAQHMQLGLCIRYKDGKMCDKKGTRIIGSGSINGVTVTLPMRMCDKHYQWYVRDKIMRG